MNRWAKELKSFKEEVHMAKKTHEEMLNSPDCKGNATRNHIKTPPDSSQNGNQSSRTQTTNVGEYEGQWGWGKQPSHTVSGNVS
jgi:hypothetical protein